MPILTPQQAILIGIVVAPVVFALCAYITRANLRRTVAGLTGVIAYCLVQYAWDLIAASLGWWSYPAYGTHGNPPMPMAIRIVGGPYQADSLARTPKHVPARETHL